MVAERMPDVAPAVEPRGTIRRILLATDLSGASDAASVQALDLARALAAELVVVSVIDPATDPVTGLRGTRIDRLREARLAAAQALVVRGRHDGVRVTFLVWEGDPGEAIVEAAASEQVDLIVVGSHGRSGVGRMLLGSVSDFVVRRAPCPVLVVRGRPTA
jgi:nucleotide-binding universal stress UspA family protein